jgi:hypothetical protein
MGFDQRTGGGGGGGLYGGGGGAGSLLDQGGGAGGSSKVPAGGSVAATSSAPQITIDPYIPPRQGRPERIDRRRPLPDLQGQARQDRDHKALAEHTRDQGLRPHVAGRNTARGRGEQPGLHHPDHHPARAVRTCAAGHDALRGAGRFEAGALLGALVGLRAALP